MSAGFAKPPLKKSTHPFRRAVLRGLAMVLPPLLTIVVFAWVWNAIESNVLTPAESWVRGWIVYSIQDVKEEVPADLALTDPDVHYEQDGRSTTLAHIFNDAVPANVKMADVKGRNGRIVSFKYQGKVYNAVSDGFIPATIMERVDKVAGRARFATADDYYQRYIKSYMNRWIVIPIFLIIFVGVLYLLGKYLAAGVGRVLWNLGESIVHRVPIIRNVYSSVKQITDFFFTEQDLNFTRVVAVEYPRKGIWSLAFVTGDGMYDIRMAAGEPTLSVLIPTSPMPATGFTITVKKSDTVEVDITVDQAIQFIVSCGVVLPPQQMERNRVAQKVAAALAERQAVVSAADE